MATINLTREGFERRISSIETLKSKWEYLGDKPAVIDFYAPWCGPCKMLSPILEDLSEEYAGKIDIYKVNVDSEEELSALFGIRSVPTLLFIPLHDAPQKASGAPTKQQLRTVIEDFLLKEK